MNELHTPMPWPAPEYCNDAGMHDDDFVEWYAIGDFASARTKADAELIVRCVNAQNSLVKALQSVRTELLLGVDGGSLNNIRNLAAEELEKVEAALAKAGAA